MKIKLLNAQWNQIAEVSSQIAQVAFASVAVPAAFGTLSQELLISGVASSCILWLISIMLKRKS